ncbi:hypothetical protein [Marinivivus vitaminiproducens]|uniref:hypothetical protein n=1 Tax=Marinivivus vitaminiproducens TaxID=3035935 RepID=UPI0027A87ECC|nr:hypothetical protein P4R82_04920 [Geminicoccaceae bacterium SCSIO 64248]
MSMSVSALPFEPHVVQQPVSTVWSPERALVLGVAVSVGLWLGVVAMAIRLFG